jgi:hypothetical protein
VSFPWERGAFCLRCVFGLVLVLLVDVGEYSGFIIWLHLNCIFFNCVSFVVVSRES